MNRATRQEIFRRLRAANPHPATELNYGNPFQLLVAVILSAQSTDVGVNKATQALFKKVKTPRAMLKLGEAGLKEHIKTIGLFNTKAKNIIKTCALLVERHGGKVPEERAALEALPGVGRKTANVVLGAAFGIPGVVVDTHVKRITGRLGLTEHTDPVKIEYDLMAIVPKRSWNTFGLQLIHFGRDVCHARKPACPECPLKRLC
ncbi:MAG: endonuclease III, partial [Gammaproteobacteria bacterium]